ncbi:MAG: hypothetical protein GWN07_24120, partial [Actinobacteria bacterium]|nr:hypothetical protein [Actinomycetota bacterium]NIS33642.1 hypothetical protein [Actinomycetota bacterium]NIT96997.1 hypothetical protein [Actinomycetota bacterium]NIU68501.1 hypothetical protein [Actinomycetota bacterium]NIV88669.1 hypothetical protein [Actinomycetota bacterium]
EATVTTAWYPTAAAEADALASRIVAMHDAGRAWSDLAILFRKNKDMLLVHEALGRHGVPFEVANLGGLLSVPEVTDLHAWLRILHAPEDGPALARILLGSRFRLGLADLVPLARWVQSRRRTSELDRDHELLPDVGLLEAVDHLDELGDLRSGAVDALSSFAAEYRDLLEVAQGASLVELSRTILDRTGAWADLDSMDPSAGLSARLNL